MKHRKFNLAMAAYIVVGIVLCALVGNALAQHQILDTYELRKKHPNPMGEEEACLVLSDTDAIFFRWMHG